MRVQTRRQVHFWHSTGVHLAEILFWITLIATLLIVHAQGAF
jgi:hypothetical protein